MAVCDINGPCLGAICSSWFECDRMLTCAVLCRRYLVHAIGTYYGLKTWSVTTGSPARREAYVSLDVDGKTKRPSLSSADMPRPLWAVI
jgi:hypothetical protein